MAALPIPKTLQTLAIWEFCLEEHPDLGDGVRGNGLWADTVVVARVKSSRWGSARDKKTDFLNLKVSIFMFLQDIFVYPTTDFSSKKGKMLL